MAELNFGILELVAGQLDKHKDRLGPLHRPLVLLLGAVLFIVFLALLIGAPIVWLEDFVYIALLQVCLVVAFFMLLLTIPLDVYDRFVFSMAAFIILAAAPIMVTLEFFLDLLQPENPVAFSAAVSSAKAEIFMYALLRGCGQLAWALPMLFLFFTFYPRIQEVGKGRLESSLRFSFWSALILHTIASSLHLWLGGTTKAFKSTEGAAPYLAGVIESHQAGFILFQSLYILAGFATVLAARRWYSGDDKRWLAIVITGMAAVQGCYMVASYNNRQIIVHYPASRTSARFVEAWKARDVDRYVFTIPRPNTVTDKFDAFRTYAVCDAPESFRFSLKVADASQFEATFVRSALGNVQPGRVFCMPASERPDANP